MAEHWVRGIFAGGVFNKVVLRVCQELTTDGMPAWQQLSEYIDVWEWPFSLKFRAASAKPFLPSRVRSHKQAESFKVPASEGLNLMPVLGYFVQKVVKPSGSCSHGCDAFLCLCDIVDALQLVRVQLTEAEYLRQLNFTFLRLCKMAGWAEIAIPKWHWMVHYHQHLERHGMLVTCWVHERKHKMVKRYSQDIANRRTYARPVLSEAVSHQLHSMAAPESFETAEGLVSKSKPPKRVMSCLNENMDFAFAPGRAFSITCARIGQIKQIHVSDTVLFVVDGVLRAGQVRLLVELESVPFAVVNHWTLAAIDAALGSANFTTGHDLHVICLSDVLSAVIWTQLSPSMSRVLVPAQFKHMLSPDA